MIKESTLILDSIFFKVPSLKILNGAFLEVKSGSICGLFGKNGSGKSTLLKIAAGQVLADSGITIIDKLRIHKKAINKRFSKIGYLPQDSMLPNNVPVKTVFRSFPTSEKERKDPIIKKIMSQNIAELSGGEQRYLELTLLFCLDRSYFLLDEPFTGIEPLIIEKLLEKISNKAKNGSGILITDHYYHYTLQIADQGYLLQNKQCYKLGHNLKSELRKFGYLK